MFICQASSSTPELQLPGTYLDTPTKTLCDYLCLSTFPTLDQTHWVDYEEMVDLANLKMDRKDKKEIRRCMGLHL